MSDLKRCTRIRIICADPDSFITQCLARDIELMRLESIDALTKEFTVYKRHLALVKEILESCSGSMRIVRRKDYLSFAVQLLFRPVLLCGVLLFLFLLMYTSGRVFFIEVTGNQKIPTSVILAKAQMYGLKFGARSADIRSEEIKNAILGDFPELQWVGVTTSGTVARIHVTERSANDNVIENSSYFGIYASRDGIISKMVVEQGTPQFHVGEKVKKGDLLISGYTDCGIKIRIDMPIGEIFAHTIRNLRLLTPKFAQKRGSAIDRHVCYKVRVGKKVINLCNHSGIQDATCVKMYEEDYWTLPGDFRLPVSVIKVSNTKYGFTSSASFDDAYQWLPQYARMYLQMQMIAGEIRKEDVMWDDNEHTYVLFGSYACQEMIGQIKSKETLDQHAEDN